MNYLFDKCVLDLQRRELRRDRRVVPIEPQIFDLLQYLLRNRDRVVSRDELIAGVWKGRIVSESTLSSRISTVRIATTASSSDWSRRSLAEAFASWQMCTRFEMETLDGPRQSSSSQISLRLGSFRSQASVETGPLPVSRMGSQNISSRTFPEALTFL
jgi:Transcriptional regulatory protein, C terminal